MTWILTILILGYPGDVNPRDVLIEPYADARACFFAEKEAKIAAHTTNMIVVTGCHQTTEG